MWGLALLFFLQDIPARPSGGDGGPTGTKERVTLEVDGTEREYRIVVPDSYDPETSIPLLFAFHGLTGSMDRLSRYSRLDELAEKKCIVVYPNGLRRMWKLRLRNNEDVGFFEALYQELTSKYNIDLNRVFVTGMSNGAYFTNLLVSRCGDKIAAAAPHSGGLGRLSRKGIDADRKVPVMIIHGDADPIVPVREAREARDRYETEGHEVEFVEIEGLRHRWASKHDINEKMWDFFMEHPLPENPNPEEQERETPKEREERRGK